MRHHCLLLSRNISEKLSGAFEQWYKNHRLFWVHCLRKWLKLYQYRLSHFRGDWHSIFGPLVYYIYHYYSILFRKMVSVCYWNVIKIINCIWENHHVFGDSSEGLLFLGVECSYSLSTDWWWIISVESIQTFRCWQGTQHAWQKMF